MAKNHELGIDSSTEDAGFCKGAAAGAGVFNEAVRAASMLKGSPVRADDRASVEASMRVMGVCALSLRRSRFDLGDLPAGAVSGVLVEDLVTPEYFIGVDRREGTMAGGGMEVVGVVLVGLNVKSNEVGKVLRPLGLSDLEDKSSLVRFIGDKDMLGFTFSASSLCTSKSSKEGATRRFAEGFRLGDEVGTTIFVLPDSGLGVLSMPAFALMSAIATSNTPSSAISKPELTILTVLDPR
jgi:hypothetical protein